MDKHLGIPFFASEKKVWADMINRMIQKEHAKYSKLDLKIYDFSVVLPEAQRKRVEKIIPYDYYEFDKNVLIDEVSIASIKSLSTDDSTEDESARERRARKEMHFNESECSEIERLETEFPKFEFKLDVPLTKKKEEQGEHANWIRKYLCQPRKERIKWKSKIYRMERDLNEMTLDEQAEALMNASAERFVKWVNALSSIHDDDLDATQVKALFSIEGENRLLSSIKTAPKEVNAIAKTVADKWDLPEMAIELKYEEYIRNRLKEVPKKVTNVAFGRTIPYRERPWVPTSKHLEITTVFPEELLSGEKLFKGIGHLRSTKALVDFYKNRPQLEKPSFLVKSGMFKKVEKTTTKQDIPLYELWKLKY